MRLDSLCITRHIPADRQCASNGVFRSQMASNGDSDPRSRASGGQLADGAQVNLVFFIPSLWACKSGVCPSEVTLRFFWVLKGRSALHCSHVHTSIIIEFYNCLASHQLPWSPPFVPRRNAKIIA
ncbi:hypothetical protein IF2G_01566 [Cordyceps javanica]|nr:hypothetical protein IF2G_01566 [Cordyceps javanica]